MYELCVKKKFIAQHYLIGGDWGAENELHSHYYEAEARISCAVLDQHGYVYDICLLKEAMQTVIARYRDQTLNDQHSFKGLNPSLEHFARILGEELLERLPRQHVEKFSLRLWEDDEAWVEWQANL